MRNDTRPNGDSVQTGNVFFITLRDRANIEERKWKAKIITEEITAYKENKKYDYYLSMSKDCKSI